MADKKENLIPFKTRFVNTVKACAIKYQANLVDYDYLLCSEAFIKNKYYIINAHKDNFLHLVGINAIMSAKQFFEKAIDGTLVESDFDFNKGNVSPKVIKGYVREKIKVLPELMDMFKYDLFAEEDFKRNSVTCLFGTSNGTFTLGIAEDGSPKSLMKNDQLDKNKEKLVELVIRKSRKSDKFDEIVYGDKEKINKYIDYIKDLLDNKII